VDIAQIRRNSVLWGCPEWRKSQDYDATAVGMVAENVYNGYAMNIYVSYWEDGKVLNMATFNWNGGTAPSAANPEAPLIRRGYIKETTWNRRPSSDRMLIVDSQIDELQVGAAAYSPINTHFQPYDVFSSLDAGRLSIDARHIRPSAPRREAMGRPSVNVLFCDGHVTTVSVREAFNAVRNPGKDTTIP